MQAPLIDVEQLRQQLTQEKENIDAWARQTTQSAKSLSDEHFQNVQEHSGTIAQLGEQREALGKEAQELQKRLAQEADVVRDLQQRLSEAKVSEMALPADIEKLQQELQREFGKVQRREAALAAAAAEQQAELATLQEAVACYSSRLGLRLERPTEGQKDLRVIFTQIDAAAPAREFSFSMHVQGDDVYEVRTCEPAVEALPEYLAALNAAPDKFGEFVRKMRRAFQAIVAAEGAAP